MISIDIALYSSPRVAGIIKMTRNMVEIVNS